MPRFLMLFVLALALLIPSASFAEYDSNTDTSTDATAEETGVYSFVSGQVKAIDQAANTVTVELYGPQENQDRKVVTFQLNDQISWAGGTGPQDLQIDGEVEVEYDEKTGKVASIMAY